MEFFRIVHILGSVSSNRRTQDAMHKVNVSEYPAWVLYVTALVWIGLPILATVISIKLSMSL